MDAWSTWFGPTAGVRCPPCACVAPPAGSSKQDVNDAEAPVLHDLDDTLQPPVVQSLVLESDPGDPGEHPSPAADGGDRAPASLPRRPPESLRQHAPDLGRRSTSAPEDVGRRSLRTSRASRPSLSVSKPRLTAEDICLSRGLRASLGFEDPAVLPSPASAPALSAPSAPQKRWSSKMNPLSLVASVREAAKRLHSVGSRESEPSVVEVARGVRIANEYDFYTADSGKIRVREMDADVIHRRPAQAKAAPDQQVEDSDDDLGSECSWTMSLGGSSRGSAREEEVMMGTSSTASRGKKEKKARVTKSNYEVVSAWGVLVGYLLHSTELDFKTLTDKVIHKKMYCKESGGRRGLVLESVRRRSRLILDQAQDLCKDIAGEPLDQMDVTWAPEGLLSRLFSTEYVDTLILVCNAACKIFAAQPTVVEASAPCRVFGDLHGQLRDLLLFLWAYGSPDLPDAPMFVFNGDFVDRGAHQLEVICLLLSLKVLLPEKVWLVRGNHEDRKMNGRYGFEAECLNRLGEKFGRKVFDVMQKAFDLMPFACVVGKKILCVHGGIGSGTWRLSELRAIKRPISGDQFVPAGLEWVNDILWSDPIEDDAEDEQIFGVHQSPRSSTTRYVPSFAWNVTKTFCARNGLSLIVRSHQAKKNGRGFDIMHEHLLMRVFSARDYERNGNDGAVLLVEEEDGLLTVRPQVLRSLAKARQSQALRQQQSGQDQ